MSIVLQDRYSVSTNGTTLTVTDRTGQISSLNEGGWDPAGTDNPIVTDATVAEIRIAKRNTDGTYGTETTVNVYDTLPSDEGGDIEISAEDAGQGDAFTDGVYRITYVVQGIWTSNSALPFLATKTVFVPITPNICTCWQRAAADAAGCLCNCGDVNKKLSNITFYMRLLDYAYERGDVVSMVKFIDILTKICAACGC